MSENRTSAVVEENLKKALVEMLMLALLHERAYYAPELNQALAERSGGAVNVSFPYAALYRMARLMSRHAHRRHRGGVIHRLGEVVLGPLD